ncbi:dihydropteroate synthase [Acetobacter sp. AN02]|uniref:dihydropteroate synthase n=1 Tax=Acetobacter sp. AN02 TaxID=2894186 RepID=UPI00243432DE|nr:dihydropteroate synthase [Acetobacter sp. AN02]MDG6095363.1 dihydropteroate synthase [Acetobacter sp. AN02]
MDHLIEPAGLLYGEAARTACLNGSALPLQGGPCAFSLVFLIEGTVRTGPVPVDRIPSAWHPVLEVVTRTPPLCGLPDRPLIMGILNVTPDSFSDGGRHDTTEAAVSAARAMIRDGADILDLGAESTNPDSAPVSPEEEWARLAPVLQALAEDGCPVPLSVDTRNASVMERALAAGAAIFNDVTALAHDPQSASVAARAGCPVVLMHMRGTPQTMSSLTQYGDVAVDMVRELEARIRKAGAAGIAREHVITDPGIGFAKTTAQNLTLLARLPILACLGCRVLLGVSRKRFIGEVASVPSPAARMPGTLAATLPALALRSPVLRVHDVAATAQCLAVATAVAQA